MLTGTSSGMNDSELRALISLLEDDDPEVKGHVHGKLISLGQEVIPLLENVWEGESRDQVQEAIEEIIYQIQSDSAATSLNEWLRSPRPDLLDGWIRLTKFQYPELDEEGIRKQISRLANRTWLELRSGMTSREKVLVINRMLFVRERFRANRKNLSDPQNFFINGLFDTRKGAPISLGILHLILSRQLEIPMNGLVLPGYFVLKHADDVPEIYVDVFNKGAFFEKSHLDQYLEEMNVAPDEKYYQPASNQKIILALMNSLMQAYDRRRDKEKIAELQRLMDKLDPDLT